MILLIFIINFKKILLPPPSKQEHSLSLNLSQFTPKSPPLATHKLAKPKPKITKHINKTKHLSKEIKEKITNRKKHTFVKKEVLKENNDTKTFRQKKVKIHTVKKHTVVPKKISHKRKTTYNNPLAKALAKSGTSLYKKRKHRTLNHLNSKMIRKLYGKEFNTYSKVQKEFIHKNLGIIHRITQATLIRNGYPEVAARTQQKGTNIVSFYLHPNGDISHLRLKKRLGYAALDKNTLEVIRIAYKSYPHPKKRTKIIFYVKYSIY